MNSTVELAGRVAVVTGGASGIGHATAVLLAERGAQVVVADFDPLQENADLFERLGIVEVQCDVRIEADVRRVIDTSVEHGGGLDILVHSAGIGMVKPITEVSEVEWDACIDTNLKGAFLSCKHAIPHLRRRGGGSIVNISSNAGLLPRVSDPVYSTSKAALVALTKSLALCHGIDRIRVNAICPGPVGETRMMNADLDKQPDRAAAVQQLLDASPLAGAYHRMIEPREVAEAVLYLASDAATMVTGTCIAIDGGKSLGVPPRK